MKAAHLIRSGINKALAAVCIFLFGAMVVIGSYQIITRYFFNRPSTVSEELLTYMFTWLSLLISAYVFGKRDHMRMGFLADKVTGKAKIILEVVIEALVSAFAAIVLLYGGIAITGLTLSQTTASLGIPMGYVYVVVPITGCLITVYGILNIIDLVRGGADSAAKEANE